MPSFGFISTLAGSTFSAVDFDFAGADSPHPASTNAASAAATNVASIDATRATTRGL